MKIIIVDSGIWISAFLKKDKHHDKGSKFLTWLNSQNTIRIVITDYIISEILAYLRRKADPLLANNALDMILTHEKIDVYYSSEEIFDKSVEIFKKYKQFSLVDATIVFFYLKLECDYLISYESGFNSFREIKTVGTPLEFE